MSEEDRTIIKDMLNGMRAFLEKKISEYERLRDYEEKKQGKKWTSKYKEYEYQRRAFANSLDEFMENWYDPTMAKYNPFFPDSENKVDLTNMPKPNTR